jgi:hypothetical protein
MYQATNAPTIPLGTESITPPQKIPGASKLGVISMRRYPPRIMVAAPITKPEKIVTSDLRRLVIISSNESKQT